MEHGHQNAGRFVVRRPEAHDRCAGPALKQRGEKSDLVMIPPEDRFAALTTAQNHQLGVCFDSAYLVDRPRSAGKRKARESRVGGLNSSMRRDMDDSRVGPSGTDSSVR